MDEWLCNPGMGAERGIKGELVSTGMCACLLKHECYAKCYCKLSRRLYVACSSMNVMPNVTVNYYVDCMYSLFKHECYAKCYCKLSRRLYVACSSMNAMPNVTVHNQLGLGVCTKLKDIFILIYFTLRSNNW